MTFTEKTKRFFEPLEGQLFLVILSVIKFSTWAIYALFSAYVVRQSVKFYSVTDFPHLRGLAIEFILFTLLYFIIAYLLRRVDWPILWHEIQRWIYKKYIRELIEMDGNMLEKIGTGRIIAVISSAEKTWIDGILHLIGEGTKIIIIATYVVYIIFSQSFLIGGVFIVLLIVLHILVIYFDSFARKYRSIRTEKKTELTRELVRIIMSRNDILQTGTIQNDMKKIDSLIDDTEQANIGINAALFKIFNLVRAFASLIRFTFLGLLLFLYFGNNVSVADIAGIFALLIVFEGFLFESTEFYKNFTKDFSDIEKLWQVFDTAPKMRGYDSGSTFSPSGKNIEIQNISYGYNETKVFDDFSLSLESGKKIALVGASGGGKTTLMKLIAGYLHPESGNISVLGNRLDETALKTYYPHIGYLTQEPGVFDATIKENLVSAVSNLSSGGTKDLPQKDRADSSQVRNDKKSEENLEQQLIKALKLAHCDFVFELEKGLDTEIGERGVRLSGGQKQRLAIAKIFLKNPEIILLDEPTSALDSFSEEQITIALDELFRNRTVIIVAHRLQTVKKADDIIVLEQGKVVERGNHESLVAKNGIYNRMLELQSGF